MPSSIPIGTFRKVPIIPPCDLHGCTRKADYVARHEMLAGWTYMCAVHFTALDCKLGPNLGQQLIRSDLPKE